ncbi:Uncharacterised protein [Klebsiella pneumoniae]|nr:Uncharacterised protein [Klebsiella pneumoniae]
MRVCSFRHLTQAQIEPFSEQDVEQTDPVATWSPGSQMGKRICETKGCINFKQHVGNPNGRHSAIQIQYECLGTIRHVCCQPVDPQRSIFYATVRNSAVTGSPGQPLKSDRESRLSVCQPILWVGRHGQFCIFLRRDHRYLLEVAIAARMSEPDISGTKSIPEVKEYRHFPKTGISFFLSS